MPWPIPAPGVVAARAAGVYEAEYQRIYSLKFPGSPAIIVDARSPISTLAVHCRVLDLSAQDIYLMQARYGQELMPDTAVDWLPRHGAIWGVPQKQPQPAIGNIVLPGGQIGAVIPAEFEFSAPGGAIYEVINAGTIEAAGTISVQISAMVPGTAGNLAAGVTLTAVAPLGGLISQSGTIDANGVTGGQDLEQTESWRPRILERIRSRGAGGDAADFEAWTQEVLPTAIVLAFSPGLGQITVALAMPVTDATGAVVGWRVPTSTELSEVTAYVNDATQRKPLGAPVVAVIAATLQPVNFALAPNPDTVATQQAISNALTLYFASADISIGSTLAISRSDAAISSATGVFNFDRGAPTGDVAPTTKTSLLTLGTVTFT